MSPEAPQDTEIQVLSNVPNEKLAEKIAQLQASDRYVSHRVLSEGGATSRIEVTVKRLVPQNPGGAGPV
jgi:hypothetical protein